jgi:hypothetical protein
VDVCGELVETELLVVVVATMFPCLEPLLLLVGKCRGGVFYRSNPYTVHELKENIQKEVYSDFD